MSLLRVSSTPGWHLLFGLMDGTRCIASGLSKAVFLPVRFRVDGTKEGIPVVILTSSPIMIPYNPHSLIPY